MYNNFSSKKTKKVISALLASALVVTSGPITADAATAKVVGIKKSITVSASATNKVTGLSKAEKKIVKVTKKGKKFTIKGLKAGKATFKIGKKSYTVKVGATTVKAAKTKLTLTKGKKATLKFTTKSGNGDTLTFKASNKNVTLAKKSAKIAKSAASVKATAKKAGKTTITATSKATGKKATVTVTVKNAAKPATTTPGASNTPVATATGSATNTPEATATATATASGSATNTPDVTATPVATATGTATATPVATGSATSTPEATEVPTEAPTKAPEVVTGGTITVTTNVTGASIKVVSGTTVVASTANTTVTNYSTPKLANGTYVVTVTKDGYKTATKEITVNGDVTLDVTLEAEDKVEVSSITVNNTNVYGQKLAITDEVPSNSTFTVKFSTVMKETSVNVNTVKVYKVDGNVPIGVSGVSFNKAKTEATISATLEANTEYQLILTDSIASDAGKKLAQTEYKIKTTNEGVLASDALYAHDAKLSNGAAGSDRAVYTVPNGDLVIAAPASDASNKGDALYVNVDKTIDASSITSDTVVLKNVTDDTTVNIKASLVSNNTVVGTAATLTPTSNQTIKIELLDNLKTKKKYSIEMNGVRLANGGKLTKVSYPFVVGSEAPQISVTQTLAGDRNVNTGTEQNPRYVNGKLTSINLPNMNTPEAGFGLVFNLSAVTDDETVTADAFALTDVTNNANIPFNFTYDASLRQVKIVPTENLPENAKIKVTTSVDASIKNTLGLALGENSFYIKSYDLTAPTVVSVTGDTTNLTVNKQHTLKITFSEEIGEGYNQVNEKFAKIADDITKVNTSSATAGLSSNNLITIVKAGEDVTSPRAGIKIDSVTRSEDKKTLTVKFTPSERSMTYQLVIAGKNDDGRAFIADLTNGTTDGTTAGRNRVDVVSNPLASNYVLPLTTEVKDVTGPEVVAIGSIKNTDKTDVTKIFGNDVTTFKDGSHNIDNDKALIVQFNEPVAFNKPVDNVGTLLNTATTGNVNGNVVLEKYVAGTWTKVDLSGNGGIQNDTVSKKGAIYLDGSVLVANAKYRLTINPVVNTTNKITDTVSPVANTMATTYTVEFTTGKVTGIQTPTTVQSYYSTVRTSVGVGATEIALTTTGNTGAYKSGDLVAIELADGSYQFTTLLTDGAVETDGTVDAIKLSDSITSQVKAGAKVYNLTKAITFGTTGNNETVVAGAVAIGTKTITMTANSSMVAGDIVGFGSTERYQVASVNGANVTLTTGLTAALSGSETATIYHASVAAAGNFDGVLTQYATGVEKDEPILIQIKSNTAKFDEDTIKNSIKLYKAADNSEVAAEVTYAFTNSSKNVAWVSINPAEDLATGTNYYVKANGLKDVLGNSQDDDSKNMVLSFKTASENKKASVSDFNVYNGQMNVGVKTAFTFKVADADKTKTDIEGSFNKDVQNTATTLGVGKIEIVDATKAAGDKVDASVSYDEATGLVTVTPTIPLEANTEYQLRISKSTFSNTAMDKDKTINFQTGEAKAPAIKSVKHIEAGETGLGGDSLIVTLDSAFDSYYVTSEAVDDNKATFTSLFTVENGQISDSSVSSIKVSTDRKTLTVVLEGSANIAAGDYILANTTLKAGSKLEAADTDNVRTGESATTAYAFGTDKVTITK